MSSFKWIATGLKNLRLGKAPPQPTLNSRLPPTLIPLVGTQSNVISPLKPKKPLSPYFRYMNQIRPEVVRENPNLKPTELMKLIGERWEKLDPTQKGSYTDSYRKEMDSFSAVYEKYRKSLTPAQIEAQEQLKAEKKLKKEKRDKKKKLKDLGRPKRPASPFLQFLSTKIPQGTGLDAQKTFAKEMGGAWNALSDADKSPFVSKYLKDLESYKKVLFKWEEEMVKQGNVDVVRKVPKPSSKSVKDKKTVAKKSSDSKDK